mgnify:FL=1
MDTRGQSTNDAWMKARKGCITASIIGQIYSMKDSTIPTRLINEIMQVSEVQDLSHIPAIKHGRMFEGQARQAYESIYRVAIEERGFMLHPKHDWLGASTDGYIRNPPSVVEIKCPMPVQGVVDLSELASQRKSWFLSYNGDTLMLNKTHKYYYQCQLQMECLIVNRCVFITYLYDQEGNFQDMYCEEITRDEAVIAQLISKASHFRNKFLCGK